MDVTQLFLACEFLLSFIHALSKAIPASLPSLAQLTWAGYMSGCDTTYVQPEGDTQLGVALGVCPDSLQHTLAAATRSWEAGESCAGRVTNLLWCHLRYQGSV